MGPERTLGAAHRILASTPAECGRFLPGLPVWTVLFIEGSEIGTLIDGLNDAGIRHVSVHANLDAAWAQAERLAWAEVRERGYTETHEAMEEAQNSSPQTAAWSVVNAFNEAWVGEYVIQVNAQRIVP
jgi:hypothetical protein